MFLIDVLWKKCENSGPVYDFANSDVAALMRAGGGKEEASWIANKVVAIFLCKW